MDGRRGRGRPSGSGAKPHSGLDTSGCVAGWVASSVVLVLFLPVLPGLSPAVAQGNGACEDDGDGPHTGQR